MLKEKLTIAIPTYNRINELINLVNSINLVNNYKLTVLIIDNKSDDEVEKKIVNECDSECLEFINNITNIGGNANILRCFEACKTDWIWIIGDDDIISKESLGILNNYISKYDHSIMMSFSSCEHQHNNDKLLKNLNDLLENIKRWSHLNFTSTSIFNRGKLINYIKYGYQYSYTWSPHIAMVLSSLNELDDDIILSSKKIIEEVSTCEDDNKWPPMGPAYSKFVLHELISKRELKRKLIDKISKSPSDYYVFLHYLFKSSNSNTTFSIIEFKSYMYRKYMYNRHLLIFLKINIFIHVIRYNWIYIKIIKLILNKKSKIFEYKNLNDRI